MTVRQTTHNSAVAPRGSSAASALATPDEDAGPAPEQSLSMFGWVGGVLERGRITDNHYLAIFDINQWYQAQMPSNLKLDEALLCPYMSFHVLDRVPGGPNEFVLGAAPKPVSWTRHMSRTCNDSDWFPAALSYDAHVLTSQGLMEYR
ncbi:protein ELYS-like isoform X2 [Penaeus japonicus]|uniref:protein ELYS-like isoform X2 n=1 Tax=Penaeus japonicus TaxID=27405 RepID=UPI001C7157C6|nr:protein ELYS-like isoform X2 [Penaeus japonicus]